MEDYKKEFIEYLLKTGALKLGEFSLKSKRLSPYFVNIGDFNEGESTSKLGEFYASAIIASKEDFDLLYGIPEKGIALAIATSIGLAKLDKNKPWFFTRKMPKEHGEATNLTKEERIKKFVVGRAPKIGQSIVQLDDVFTTGDAKYEALDTLNSLGDLGAFRYPLLAIAVDRQEVGIDGKSAIVEYQAKTGVSVVSVVNAVDILDYFREIITSKGPDEPVRSMAEGSRRLANYLRVYGTKEARDYVTSTILGKLEQKVIEGDRSVIPACDVPTIEKFEEIVKKTAEIVGIGGYKIGFELALNYSLPKVVETVRKYTEKPIIYDHQKAGTDITDTGKNFARTCKAAGVDAIILFPQAGPETERAWIYHALNEDLKVIVGGRMTHPAYSVSEGGFITDEGALEMYRIAASAGINNFVVPGNKPDVIKQVKELIEAQGVEPVFYAPGFIAQGGKIEDAAKVAGDKFHGIVGRGIFEAQDMVAAALEYTSQI